MSGAAISSLCSWKSSEAGVPLPLPLPLPPESSPLHRLHLPRPLPQGSSVQFSCSVVSDSLQCHGLPVHHQHLELTQIHVHRVGDAIQSSHPVIPFSHLQSFPASQFFPMRRFFASGGQSTRASASASVFQMNIQD